MSLTCESEIRVLNENAIRFSIFSKPPPVLDYVKALSALIGSSHILAVFEEADSIKVFFDDKTYVDMFIKCGLHILGHHVKSDYVVPPGTKVILYNVDPIISNLDVTKLLSAYGSIVSPIMRPPISHDPELCHIGSGIRYTYMLLCTHLPSSIAYKYGDLTYDIKVQMEDRQSWVPYIKTDNPVEFSDDSSNMLLVNYENHPGPSGSEQNPVIINAVSAVQESHLEGQVQIQSTTSLMQSNEPEKGHPGRPRRRMHIFKRTSTFQAANKIKKNVKQNLVAANKYYKRKKCRKVKNRNSATGSTNSNSTTSSSSKLIAQQDLDDNVLCNSLPRVKVMETEALMKYVEEVKHHRAPLEFAKSYLKTDWDAKTILAFIEQLKQYQRKQNSMSLKLRISRLIKCIQDSVHL